MDRSEQSCLIRESKPEVIGGKRVLLCRGAASHAPPPFTAFFVCLTIIPKGKKKKARNKNLTTPTSELHSYHLHHAFCFCLCPPPTSRPHSSTHDSREEREGPCECGVPVVTLLGGGEASGAKNTESTPAVSPASPPPPLRGTQGGGRSSCSGELLRVVVPGIKAEAGGVSCALKNCLPLQYTLPFQFSWRELLGNSS